MLRDLDSAPDDSILSHSAIHQEGPYKPEERPSIFSQTRYEGNGSTSGNKEEPSSYNIFGQNTEQNVFKPLFSKEPNKNNNRLFGDKK